MWVCSGCGARVEPDFEVCWRCGTSYQGEADPDFVSADECPPIEDPADYLKLDAGKFPDPEVEGPAVEYAPCFECNDLAQAKFVADRLGEEGIPSTLQNTTGAGQYPASAFVLYPCQVLVLADDLPRAEQWVKAYRARQKVRHQEAD